MEKTNLPKNKEQIEEVPGVSMEVVFSPENMALLERFCAVENLGKDEAIKKILIDRLTSWEKNQDKIKKSGQRYSGDFDMYD